MQCTIPNPANEESYSCTSSDMNCNPCQHTNEETSVALVYVQYTPVKSAFSQAMVWLLVNKAGTEEGADQEGQGLARQTLDSWIWLPRTTLHLPPHPAGTEGI